jgi:tetratricopeptide (TPR) repeat protein
MMRTLSTTSPNSSKASPSSPARANSALRLGAAVLMVFGALAYGNALRAPYVLDDTTAITGNRTIRQLSPLSGLLRPPPDTPVAGRPIVNLTFAINYAYGELDPTGYHLVNLSIHLLASLVLFGIVRRTLRLPTLLPIFGDAALGVAWLAAALWMLHPLNSEVVDYVTQRSESLMGLAYLATLYCAIRGGTVEAAPEGRRDRRGKRRPPLAAPSPIKWEAAACVCCAAGMLCKESMVTAPVMLALYDRVFLFDSFAAALQRRRRLYAGILLSWLVLAVSMATSQRTSVGFAAGTSPLVYVLNQIRLIPHYFALSVWPRALVIDYGLPQPLSPGDVLLPGIALAIIVIASLVLFVRLPRLGFGAVWCFVTLAPTSTLVPIATEVGAERRMYLPLAGLVVVAVCGAYLLLRQWSWRWRAGLAVTLCMLAATGTVLRNREYLNTLVLARSIVERWPSGRGHFILGTELVNAGDSAGAIEEFRRAAVDYPGGHYGLATELTAAGNIDEGIAEAREFIRLAPRDRVVPVARDLIGRALMSRGELDAAAAEFTQILAEQPNFVRAHVFLGDVRLRQGRVDEAILSYQRARALDANVGRDTAILSRMGMALGSVHRYGEAVQTLREAVALQPQNGELHKQLGQLLAASGRVGEALPSFERAVQLSPNDQQAQTYLAAARQAVAHPTPAP